MQDLRHDLLCCEMLLLHVACIHLLAVIMLLTDSCVCPRDPLGDWKSLGNPCTGGSDLENAFTFFSQPNFVMAMPEHPSSFVFMADQWDPEDLSASRSASTMTTVVITPLYMLVSMVSSSHCECSFVAITFEAMYYCDF